MNFVVEIENLVMQYGSLRALDGMSLKIREGSCFGILGPNGAGKTSLLEILEGIRTKTSGKVKILGKDIDKDMSAIQSRIGVQLQENNYFDLINLRQILSFFHGLYPDAPYTTAKLFSMVGLDGCEAQLYKNLSGGQKQRFSIAVSMVNDADLLIFDEPTTGLDPQNRRFIWDLINELKRKNKSIILTTHYMDEAENLCDDIAIVEKGKLMLQGSPEQLINTIHGGQSISFATIGGEFTRDELARIKGVEQLAKNKQTNSWRLWSGQFLDTTKRVYEFAAVKGLEIVNYELDRVTLEDVFLSLTGRGLRD